jgi:drug/metabolite transporter (DMT)-like permease
VISVLGGLGAALAFATTTFCSARATRLLGAYAVLSWVMLVGLVLVVPLLAVQGVPDGLDAGKGGWLALAGCGNVTGLLLTYRALRVGKVSIVAPITSTEGAIAAVISIVAGEHVGGASGAMLGLVAAGILLASLGPATTEDRGRGHTVATVLLATAAACAFGASLYAVGRVGKELPIGWALIPARAVGVAFVAAPLALSARLRLTRAAAPYLLVGGVCEVLGLASFTVGARHGLAVSAVLASQFGAIAAVAGFVSFRERLTRLQLAGVVAIAAGVAILSALQS